MFKPGDPKPENSGRKPGSLNKKNQEIIELAKELNCDPAKVLMLIMMGDAESLKCHPTEIDLDKRMSAAKELMPFLYGKRKPIDSDGDDSGVTLADIAEVLKK